MRDLQISYLTLRKSIGITGMLLAGLVALGGIFAGLPLQDSISAYYWTTSQDILVGTLAIAGAFLLSYRGYDNLDRIITAIAGVFALGIALFPVAGHVSGPTAYFQLPASVTNILHFVFSGGFFVLLAYMSYFQFTKGKNRSRNRVYRICGIAIIAAFVTLILFKVLFPTFSVQYNVVFWMEAVMLIAFGISWLTKGKVFVTS